MKPIEIHLSDYKKPEFEFEQVYLHFKLDPEKTIVNSEIKLKRIVKNGDKNSALVLNGKELKLISLAINGVLLDQCEFKTNNDLLEISSDKVKNSTFTLNCTTEINPKSNTALEGLYLSNGIY